MLLIKCTDGSLRSCSDDELCRWDLRIEGILHVVLKDGSELFFPLCNIISFGYEVVKNES